MNLLLLLFSALLLTSLRADPYPGRSDEGFPGWREKREELLELLLPEDPLIVHAGAHVGNELIRFLIRWPYASLFAIEPNPHTFQILSDRLKDFHFTSLSNIALSDRTGKAPFYLCYGSGGDSRDFEHASSLLPPSKSMGQHLRGPVIEVMCETLSDWCSSHAIEMIDCLSLDLQGSELAVLKSSENIVRNCGCISLHTYLFPFREGTDLFDDVKEYLESLDFILVSHWYRKGLEGDAIFVSRLFFRDDEVDLYVKSHPIESSSTLQFVPSFNVLYHLNPSYKIPRDEDHLEKILHDFAMPGSVAIDVSAGIGIYTVAMARRVGPEGAVIAFEPNRKLYAGLIDTLKLNRVRNVLPLAKDCTRSLDSLNISNLSLLKIDGEIYPVLKGAEETIERNRPVVVFSINENFERIRALFNSYRYEVRTITSNDFIAFPKEADGFLERAKQQFNTLY